MRLSKIEQYMYYFEDILTEEEFMQYNGYIRHFLEFVSLYGREDEATIIATDLLMSGISVKRAINHAMEECDV